MVDIPKPIPKMSFPRWLAVFAGFLILALAAGSAIHSAKEAAVDEFWATNHDEFYNSAYSDGYDDGFEDGRLHERDTTEAVVEAVGVCDSCEGYYDPLSVFYSGFGLCDGCGDKLLTSCRFCDERTYRWSSDAWDAVCPRCMGFILKETGLEELLEEYANQ